MPISMYYTSQAVHIRFVVLFSDCKVIFALLSGTLPFAAKTELDPKTKVSSVDYL